MASYRDGCPDRVTVLIDANALMAQLQFRIDIFAGLTECIGAFEPVLLDCVRDELRGLAASHGKEGSSARSALILAERCTIAETGMHGGSVDEKILYYASTHGCMVFTNDRDLRTTLLAQGIPVISLAGKQRLEVYRN
ncbi:MAG: PIN domain-containing protein [Methanomicrobiales archaeon]|nr:nucleotide-binding protein [Methanoregulaceae archaeon]NLH26505.1 nucleotide-binding protein [Methanomicrobiales archaeon]MBP7716497.1 nucleotide-binding protein [Methanoregulaceae archaeon]HNJ80798.1 nucleotide-binding protein [Methanoregulaceae archaeon]HNL85918.1 nucleotide-binding protein [Methanoregulaceae archaeon]